MSGAASIVEWTSWPARDRPVAACVGLVAVAVFGLAGAGVAGSAAVGAIAGLALFCCLQRFYFPVHCAIGSDEAVVRTLLATRRIRLSAVRRVAHDGRAILLSTRSASSTADVISGFVLPLPSRDAERVLRETLALTNAVRKDASP
ncbi:MAG: hypothetical protein U0572_06515 [Phycisphaerales bacterium]